MKIKDLTLIIFFSFWGLDQAYKHAQDKAVSEVYRKADFSPNERALALEQIKAELSSHRKSLQHHQGQDRMLLSRRIAKLEKKLELTTQVDKQEEGQRRPKQIFAYVQ